MKGSRAEMAAAKTTEAAISRDAYVCQACLLTVKGGVSQNVAKPCSMKEKMDVCGRQQGQA